MPRTAAPPVSGRVVLLLGVTDLAFLQHRAQRAWYGTALLRHAPPRLGQRLSLPHVPAPLRPPSVATPHVSGAAALYAARHLEKKGIMPTADNIKAAILGSAQPTDSLAGKCVSNGRLNVARLLGLEP